MTTRLTRPVSREVQHTRGVTDRPLIVTLTEAGIMFREKGRRRELVLPYGVAYLRAAFLEADRARRSRRASPRNRRCTSRGLLAVSGGGSR